MTRTSDIRIGLSVAAILAALALYAVRESVWAVPVIGRMVASSGPSFLHAAFVVLLLTAFERSWRAIAFGAVLAMSVETLFEWLSVRAWPFDAAGHLDWTVWFGTFDPADILAAGLGCLAAAAIALLVRGDRG